MAAKPSLPSTTPEKPILGPSALVCYSYSSGELEGGSKMATDPVWSMSTHTISNVIRKTDSPSMDYLIDGPARGFVREELQVVPADTALPPKKIRYYPYTHTLVLLFHQVIYTFLYRVERD